MAYLEDSSGHGQYLVDSMNCTGITGEEIDGTTEALDSFNPMGSSKDEDDTHMFVVRPSLTS